ncbi:MAG: UvrD-helicase domain-containing protein [Deltaproteobacteria bacterium]|nr:UvrD-helicase domain-containing protein [Deltaproteobacteria bacterium]
MTKRSADALALIKRHVRLNAEQEAAVVSDAPMVAVSAGAGTGKTATLTAKFVYRVLRETTDAAQVRMLRRILTITFTEKAAAEMSERIADLFERLGRADLRRELDGAYISTIDSFCHRLLKAHPVEARIDPGFGMIDETSAALLADETMRDVLNELPDDLPDWAGEIPVGDSDLPSIAKRFYEALVASGREFSEIAHLVGDGDDLAVRDAQRRLMTAMGECEPALDPDKHAEGIALLREVRAAFDDPEANESDRVIATQKLIDLGGKIPATGKILKGLAYEAKRDAPKAFLAAVADVHDRQGRRALIEIARRFHERYGEAKRRRGLADFADLEATALRLLENADHLEIRRRIREQFDLVMVDECQDINRLQDRIIELLSEERPSFRVGDVKQSIYGFRHADVNVFASYLEKAREAGEENVIGLATNYRSRERLLTAVNVLFQRTFDDVGLGHGTADRVEYKALVAGSDRFDERDGPAVDVHLSIAPDDDDSPKSREFEAMSLARYLDDTLQSGAVTVATNDDTSRPLRPGDVVVLMTTLTDAEIYRRAFEARRIPAVIDGGKGLYGTPEVRALADAVAVIANPRDERALVGVLMSGPVGVGPNGLMLLRSQARGPEVGLFDLLADATDILGMPGDEGRACERLAAALAAVRRDLPALDGQRLCERLVDGLGLHRWTLAQDAPGRRTENLAMVCRAANGIAEPHGGTAAALAYGFKVLADDSSARQAGLGEGGDAVTIMTIHGSKGLQFPFVILADLNRRGRNQSDPYYFAPGDTNTPPRLAVHWRPLYLNGNIASAAFEELKEHHKARERAEAARLFYVACTRAQEHLCVSAAVTPTQSKKIGSPQPMIRWLLDGWGIADNADEWADENVLGDVRLLVRRDVADDGPTAVPNVEENDIAKLKAGYNAACAVAPMAVEHVRPIYTVTRVARFAECPRRDDLIYRLGLPRGLLVDAEADFDFDADDRAGDNEATRLSAADFGSLFHEAMERWDADEATILATLDGMHKRRDFDKATRKALSQGMHQFARHELGAAARAGTAVRELALAWPVEDAESLSNDKIRLLRGTIDLCVAGNEGVTIVDYKTDRVHGDEAVKAEKYAAQLLLYADGAERYFRKPVTRAVLYFARSDTAVDVDLSPERRSEAAALVQRFFDAERTGTAPEGEGVCAGCPHLEICSDWVPHS